MVNKTNVNLKNLFLYLIFIITVSAGYSQQKQSDSPQKTRILFLIDGSNSMNGDWNNEGRWEAAKGILENLVDSLKVYKNLELGLRVYGHQTYKAQQNCKDTKLEAPFSIGNHEAIKAKLDDIKPKGVTPLAYSLEQCAKDFPKQKGVRNIIIIITDGIESCGGDPCKVSKALQRKNIFLKPFVVGIGLKRDYSKDFECIGTYYNANDSKDFNALLQKVIVQALGKTEVRVDLLDQNKKATETNVNVSFENKITKDVIYDYVHFIGSNGKPDLLKVDPVITYNIRVNTIPAVYKKNVSLEGGKLNVIKIDVPQGFLEINLPSHKEYKSLNAIIRKNGKTIHSYTLGKLPLKLLEGDYELELLTMPRVTKKIKIVAGEINRVTLPAPGLLNVIENTVGFGSIYKVSSSGRETWIYNFPKTYSGISLPMQPGKYKVVFRSKNALGADYTSVKYFNIKSGSSSSVKLF